MRSSDSSVMCWISYVLVMDLEGDAPCRRRLDLDLVVAGSASSGMPTIAIQPFLVFCIMTRRSSIGDLRVPGLAVMRDRQQRYAARRRELARQLRGRRRRRTIEQADQERGRGGAILYTCIWTWVCSVFSLDGCTHRTRRARRPSGGHGPPYD
jgi:hypothetical protein